MKYAGRKVESFSHTSFDTLPWCNLLRCGLTRKLKQVQSAKERERNTHIER